MYERSTIEETSTGIQQHKQNEMTQPGKTQKKREKKGETDRLHTKCNKREEKAETKEERSVKVEKKQRNKKKQQTGAKEKRIKLQFNDTIKHQKFLAFLCQQQQQKEREQGIQYMPKFWQWLNRKTANCSDS